MWSVYVSIRSPRPVLHHVDVLWLSSGAQGCTDTTWICYPPSARPNKWLQQSRGLDSDSIHSQCLNPSALNLCINLWKQFFMWVPKRTFIAIIGRTQSLPLAIVMRAFRQNIFYHFSCFEFALETHTNRKQVVLSSGCRHWGGGRRSLEATDVHWYWKHVLPNSGFISSLAFYIEALKEVIRLPSATGMWVMWARSGCSDWL